MNTIRGAPRHRRTATQLVGRRPTRDLRRRAQGGAAPIASATRGPATLRVVRFDDCPVERLDVRLADVRLADVRLPAAFFFGTLAPAFRASERPIAIACLRLVTLRPDLPLLSVPRFLSCIARFTFDWAALPYFRIASLLRSGARVPTCSRAQQVDENQNRDRHPEKARPAHSPSVLAGSGAVRKRAVAPSRTNCS